jgi:hypothetical protein
VDIEKIIILALEALMFLALALIFGLMVADPVVAPNAKLVVGFFMLGGLGIIGLVIFAIVRD